MTSKKTESKFIGQTVPNIHKVLDAIRELEKDPAVLAYIRLMESLPDYTE